MTNKPRKHHFIPQFWIKKFHHSDGNYYVYDSNSGNIATKHPRNVMQLINLYTIEPENLDDVTLETVDLNKVDNKGNTLFNKLINGQIDNNLKNELADFFAVQILRDPQVVSSYTPQAQNISLSLLEIIDENEFEIFKAKWEAKYPGANIYEHEFIHLKKLDRDGDIENIVENIIVALSTSGGIPELPFTDVVRSPDSRKIIKEQLMEMSWTLKNTSKNYILGDMGAIYNKGEMDHVRIPISPSKALFLEKTGDITQSIELKTAEDFEVESLNIESAAYARRWIVGEPSTIDTLKIQVGKNIL